MKKLISVLLAALLALSLAACGETAGNETEGTTRVEPLQTGEPETGVTEETRETGGNKTETDGSGKIIRFGGAEVTVRIPGDAGGQEGAARVLAALNTYFLNRWDIDADFILMPEESYREQVLLLLTDAEACDIFCSGLLGFQEAAEDFGLCYDLYDNNLIQTYGEGILKRVGYEYLNGCESWGGLYGVPAFGEQAEGQWCIAVSGRYLREIGYDMTSVSTSDVNEISLEELTALFTALKEKYPDKYILHPGDYGTLSRRLLYDPLGGDDFGVLLDPVNSTEVSDLFSSRLFADYCDTMRTWYSLGFIPPESGSGDDTAAEVLAGRIMADTTSGVPGIGVSVSKERSGMETVVFQLGGNFVNSVSVVSGVWSIDSLCENPEAAMVVLNALYTDTKVENLLLWGEEDTDYQVTQDGHVTFAKGRSEDNSDYYGAVSLSALPCKLDTYIWEGWDTDLWERTEELCSSAEKSLAIGFRFRRDSDLTVEYEALTNVVNEKIDDLIFGRADPAEAVPELLNELSEAGLGSYISEKQAQFRDWAVRMGKEE